MVLRKIPLTSANKYSAEIEIKVKTLTGKELVMKVDPNCLVEEIKNIIQAAEGIPPDQ